LILDQNFSIHAKPSTDRIYFFKLYTRSSYGVGARPFSMEPNRSQHLILEVCGRKASEGVPACEALILIARAVIRDLA
jgi:hypothetical protein